MTVLEEEQVFRKIGNFCEYTGTRPVFGGQVYCIRCRYSKRISPSSPAFARVPRHTKIGEPRSVLNPLMGEIGE